MRAMAIVVVGALVVSARPAIADELEPGDTPAYRELLKEGVGEYDARHYEEARALFARAHALNPNARTLRGLGMACFELRDYVGAIRHLRGALREKRKPLTVEQRVHVSGLIERALTYVGTFEITLKPADAALTIDGQPAQREEGGAILIGFGRHALVATCPSCEGDSRTIAVNGGEHVSLAFNLAPAIKATPAPVPPVAPAAVPPPAPAKPKPVVQDGAHGSAPWGLWAAAGGAGVLTGAGVFWWFNRAHELDHCHDAGDACANTGTLQSEKNLALTAAVAGGVATLTLVTVALVWNLTSESTAPRAGSETRPQVACVPLSAGLSYAGVGCTLGMTF
jgi:hypothetical protein